MATTTTTSSQPSPAVDTITTTEANASNDGDSYDRLCMELDELTLSYVFKMNQYTQDRTAASSVLQKGFLELAHAKYTMGDKTIAHSSYDERMKARLSLKVDHKSTTPYSMLRIPNEHIDLGTTYSKGLRQRTENETEWMQRKDLKTGKEEFEMDEKKPVKKVRKMPTKANGDPLHWFGLLVSPSLRTSQDHFQTATTHLIDMANLVHELQTMEKRYESLVKKKDALLRQRSSVGYQ